MSLQSNDFSSNSLEGNLIVSGGAIVLDLGVNPGLLEGDKTFDVRFRRFKNGPLLVQTNTITLKDYSTIESFTANTATINEGVSVQYTLVTSNVTGNVTLYYTTVGNVTYEDFVGGNTGSFVLVNNTANIVLTANLDLTDITENGESFSLQIRNDSITGNVIATSDSVEIFDTSNVIGLNTFSLSSNVIYESESVLLTLNTFNAVESGVLYYTVTGNADIFGNVFGSIMVNNNIANLEIIAEASIPDNEARQLSVQIRRDSISGTILGTTENVLVRALQPGGTTNVFTVLSATGGNEIIEIDI